MYKFKKHVIFANVKLDLPVHDLAALSLHLDLAKSLINEQLMRNDNRNNTNLLKKLTETTNIICDALDAWLVEQIYIRI